MKNKRTNTGITLIALVITIIVMLILVSVTISMAINGGLFGYAGKAVGDTQNAIDKEKELSNGQITVDGKTYANIDDYINNKPMGAYYYCVSATDSTKSETPTKYIASRESGKILGIGDYIEYTPKTVDQATIDALYADLEAYAGASGSYDKTTYSLAQDTNLKWRIYDITEDGNLLIISDKPTTQKVYLRGSKGYNNAVYLLDKICKELYSGEGAEARSLKIEDIESKLSYKYKEYSNGTFTYGNGPTSSYGSGYNYFPVIHQKENEDGTKVYQEKELSTQETPVDGTYVQGTLQPKQTYWYKSMVKSDFNDYVDSNSKYYEMLINNGSNYNTYWLSSRAVNCNSYYAYFSVRDVGSGGVYANYLFYSYDINFYYAFALRPLVSLLSAI